MTRKDSFTYSVVQSDFPISVEVESFDQATFMGFISDGIVLHPADSAVITTFPLSLQSVSGKPNVQRCQIPDPSATRTPADAQYQPPADVILTLVVSFATTNGPSPRYEVKLVAAAGGPQIRNIRPRSLRDFFVLEYR